MAAVFQLLRQIYHEGSVTSRALCTVGSCEILPMWDWEKAWQMSVLCAAEQGLSHTVQTPYLLGSVNMQLCVPDLAESGRRCITNGIHY